MMRALILSVFVLFIAASGHADVDPTSGVDLYSTNFLGKKAPDSVLKLTAEQWVTRKPQTNGKFVLINFSASWCPPCREFMPQFENMQKVFAKNLAAIEVWYEDKKTVEDTTREIVGTPSFSEAIDSKKVMFGDLGVQAFPVSFLLDPDGIVRYQGYPLGEDPLTPEKISKIIKSFKK
jgi:cytochrome c biogenesis protein CcmG/thiol:disulfide interchange protein DsbE